MLFRLSSYNSLKDNIITNNVTGKSIGNSELVQNFIPSILSEIEVKSNFDKIVCIIQKELLMYGIIVPEYINISSEKSYLINLFPITLPISGFFYSQVTDFRGLDKDLKKSIAFLGVPCDLGAKKPGTRYGSTLLRDISRNLNFRGNCLSILDIASLTDPLKNRKIFDIGNIKLQDTLSDFIRIVESVIPALPVNTVPIMIGGDHALSFGSIKGTLKKVKKPFTIIQLDHHLDLQLWGNFKDGKPDLEDLTHANFMSWINNDMPDIKIYQIGMYDYQSASAENFDNAKKYVRKISKIITNFSILYEPHNKILSLLPSNQDIYLTIDVDIINSIYMSQTGYPGHTGISLESFVRLIRDICRKNNIIGVDIMEFGMSNKLEPHLAMGTFLCSIILDIIKIGIFKE